jgi:hypothetical protein
MSDDYDDLRRRVKAATPAEQVESLECLINLLLRHGVSFPKFSVRFRGKKTAAQCHLPER